MKPDVSSGDGRLLCLRPRAKFVLMVSLLYAEYSNRVLVLPVSATEVISHMWTEYTLSGNIEIDHHCNFYGVEYSSTLDECFSNGLYCIVSPVVSSLPRTRRHDHEDKARVMSISSGGTNVTNPTSPNHTALFCLGTISFNRPVV